MQDGAAEYHVGKRVRERHRLDRFHAKVVCRKGGGERCGQTAGGIDCLRVGVDAVNVVPLMEEVDKVASGTAGRVEDPHTRRDPSAEELIEEVDIDLAELLMKICHAVTRASHPGFL